ncbi:hypothetical protein ACIQZI_12650 [Peribacillus sp. NPDC096379]|uniref:hypothetical protein n=1 Tax=Peribacillus sp. NPDC096379 TaxID=3364393 RepID=UPI0007807539
MSFIERVIEKLIGDGIITEEELQARNEEEKAKSPILPLLDDSAAMLFQTAMQDMAIMSLQDENAELLFRLVMMEANANV